MKVDDLVSNWSHSISAITYEYLQKLASIYGESYYLLDIRRFVNNYTRFLDVFKAIYPRTSLAYSYKTNYTPALCRKANELGGYAEVVSRMEYELAIHIGIAPNRIIFNGPVKLHDDMQRALLAGSIVNIDNAREISMLKTIARENPDRSMTAGLRCNFDLGESRPSRFGLDASSEEFYRHADRLRRQSNVRLAGLHCHFSTAQRSTESFALRAQAMIEISNRCFRDELPDFIDIGGGFFGRMAPDLASQFDHPVPGYQDYADVIASLFAKEFGPGDGPELILEPGIGITGDVMSFICLAIHIKEVRSCHFVTTTGSIYDIKPTLNDKQLPMHVFHPPGRTDTHDKNLCYDVSGYTCVEDDILRKQYQGFIEEGDFLVFDQVGAYTNVMKPPFIRPSPAILMYDEETGSIQPARNPESMQDIINTYVY